MAPEDHGRAAVVGRSAAGLGQDPCNDGRGLCSWFDWLESSQHLPNYGEDRPPRLLAIVAELLALWPVRDVSAVDASTVDDARDLADAVRLIQVTQGKPPRSTSSRPRRISRAATSSGGSATTSAARPATLPMPSVSSGPRLCSPATVRRQERPERLWDSPTPAPSAGGSPATSARRRTSSAATRTSHDNGPMRTSIACRLS